MITTRAARRSARRAAAGAKGGRTTGPTKARGSSEHYQHMRALRDPGSSPDKLTAALEYFASRKGKE